MASDIGQTADSSTTQDHQTFSELERNHSRKFKNKKIVIPVVIAGFIFLFLFVTTLSAYGYIPAVNNDFQKKVAYFVMSLPLMPKSPVFVLEKSTLSHQNITHFSIETTLTSESNQISPFFWSNNININAKGSIDLSDINNPSVKMQAELNEDITLDLIIKDAKTYYKINTISSELISYLVPIYGTDEFTMNKFLNKWISPYSLPHDADARRITDENKINKDQLLNDQIEALSKAFFKNTTTKSLLMKSENLENERVFHIIFNPSDEELDNIWESYLNHLYTDNEHPRPQYSLSKYMSNTNIELWVGEKDYLVRKLAIYFDYRTPSSDILSSPGFGHEYPLSLTQELPVSLVVNFSNYNQKSSINPPENPITFEDFINEILQSSTSSAGLYPTNQFSQANNTIRRSDVNAILNAISQYAADNRGQLPPGISALPGEISSNRVNLCTYLVPDYIAEIPTDPDEVPINSGIYDADGNRQDCTKEYETGYLVSVTQTGKVTVSAPNAELDEKIQVTR